MATPRLRALEAHIANISPATNWMFVRAESSEGAIGWGESSLNGREPAIRAEVERLAAVLVGTGVDARHVAIAGDPALPLAVNAARSGIEQALVDLEAQAAGRSIGALLAAAPRARVPGYANINRRTRDRSAAGCAASARLAVAAGFRAVKIAPFDDVTPAGASTPAGRALVHAALERIAAVRGAVGRDVAVLIDAHWRLDEPTALALVPELEALGVSWFECPLVEGPAYFAATRGIRAAANARGIRLAGAELLVGAAGFAPTLEAGVFDVVMPDLKYCGGYRALLEIDALAAKHGAVASPHNPSGPVCHVGSVHVAACTTSAGVLEHQFDESPRFGELVRGVVPAVGEGAFVRPDAPGLGCAIDRAVLARHPHVEVPLGPEARATG